MLSGVMLPRIFRVAVIFALTLFAGQGLAISDTQYRAVEQMGKLNGVALQCRYFEQTKIIKKALVNALPKRRQLGEAFERVTHDSFMEFMESQATCPEETDFNQAVEEAIRQLNQVFAGT